MKLFIIVLFCFLGATYANDDLSLKDHHQANTNPLRTIKEVQPDSVPEKVFKLARPQVLIADYSLIRRDFPSIAHLSNNEIDNWLIKETGFISQGQQAQTKVNTHIQITESATRQASRPPEYGRALVYEVHDMKAKNIGVIDVKGAGGVKPSHASHKSGTMTLGESLREFSYEKMITNIVDHAGIENKVVAGYAVISPGFDVIHPDGSKSAAGFYLRQGHRRYTQAEHKKLFNELRGNGWMDQNWRSRYKSLLNHYGVFANENYQGTIKNDLFDFGHYIVREDLKNSAKNTMIPFEQWGFDNPSNGPIATQADRWKFSKMDRPWVWSHDTAQAFVNGRATRHHVWLNHYNLIAPVQEKLKSAPSLYKENLKLGFSLRNCSMYFTLK